MPGKSQRLAALVVAAIGLGAPLAAQAQSYVVELMGGSAYNVPTPLAVYQAGYPAIRTTAVYDTKPFGPYTPYFALRFARWDGDSAWELDWIHHRLFLENPPPEVQYFAIHFGYNYVLLGRGWRQDGFSVHVGVGPMFTNPVSTVRGQYRPAAGDGLPDAGYYLSGIGAEVALEKEFRLWRGAYFALQAALTVADAWSVPIANGHANVPNVALHGQAGFGYRF